MDKLKIKHKTQFPRSVILLLGLIFVTVSFSSGFFIGQQQGIRSVVPEGEGRVIGVNEIPRDLDRDVDFQLFWNVWNFIKDSYIEQPVSEVEMFYGAVAGMVDSLGDPHSVFFDPDSAAAFNQELEGAFEGIGAEIGIKDDQLTIVAPLPDSPAEKAGLMSGDKVYFIDGEDTSGMTVEEAVLKIRGEKGTGVILTIGRDGISELTDITIIRDTINIDSVIFEMKDDIALVSIYFFNEDTASLFNEYSNQILENNAQGIILDLRSNPGGLLDQAIFVAGEWVDGNLVAIQETRDRRIPLNAMGVARLRDIPTVVLVDGGTASGSEIVAGALQDYNLATIVGTQTFGKGSVQDYEELPDGSAVKITIAKWLTPSGRSINNEGIEPDIIVEFTQDNFLNGEDPQMDMAFQILGG